MKGMSLDNLASQEELDTLKQVDGMTHEPGFGPEQLDGESLVDLGFSQLNLQGQPGAFGADNPFDTGIGGFSNALEQQQQQAAAAAKTDWGDVLIAATGKGLKATGILLRELIKSTVSRTADDWGYFGRNAMIAGIPTFILGLLFLIMAGPTGWAGFGFFGLGGVLLLAGIGTSGVGGIAMGIAAEILAVRPVPPAEVMAELPDTNDQAVGAYIDNIDDSIDNVVTDDLINELDDILGEDMPGMGASVPEIELDEPVPTVEMPDFDALERQLQFERKTITRANLISTFLPYFMKKTPEFREVVDIEPGTQTYDVIRATIVKAIANLQNIPLEKVTQKCLSMKETFFSYKVVFERVKKMKNTKDMENELETYFRATVNDPNLNEEEIRKQRLRIKVTVESEGDNWNITINKGVSGIITVGDILAGQKELAFFKNEKNILPIIAGITESGSVILEDAQYLDNMMITGKQRSGKSWYVNSILTSLVTFNSPEDVALIIVDPKNSTMFNTLALFPHVIGKHDGQNILDIFREIIEVEAPKRATLLSDSRCENIKDYNKLHPDAKMPRLYVVIDEVISVRDGLLKVRDGEKEAEAKNRVKEFNSSMLTIMSKMPYIGIGLIFIPHRATGIIDKTARTLLKLKAAVMAEEDEIDETLGEAIDRRLTAPGDIALRVVSMESARFVRGPAVADDDMKTAETLRRIAKGFYSLGVEVPKWNHLRKCYVDNSEDVQKELFGNTTRIRY